MIRKLRTAVQWKVMTFRQFQCLNPPAPRIHQLKKRLHPHEEGPYNTMAGVYSDVVI